MATENDIKPQQDMYHRVLGMFKYGGVICGVIALAVVYLISAK